MTPALISKVLRSLWRHPGYTGSVVQRKIRLAGRYRWIEDPKNLEKPIPWPLVIKLVLTHQCNLRCEGCFQQGAFAEGGEGTVELDVAIVERLLREMGPRRPDFILTGGEPLLHSRFRDLLERLREHRCYTTLCTNGTRLGHYRDTVRANRYLSYLISLDGTEEVNDAIRGKGVFRKVTEEIRFIKSLKRPPYIGIQLTLRESNIGGLFAFCREMVDLGVDWILLNPFWFMTPEEAGEYEALVASRFGSRPRFHEAFITPYHPDCDAFVEELGRIRRARWPIQISSYFTEPEQLRAYLEEPEALTRDKRCYKQWVRMDVTPEGDVSPCIQFPDITFGNLGELSAMDAWNHPDYRAFRRAARQGNLPVCAKCNNLYLYDAKRKHL